jgi:hypothetical protein
MPTKPTKGNAPTAQTAEALNVQKSHVKERAEPMNPSTASKNESAVLATSQPVGFIRFHGMTLLVVEYLGIEYIEARPLCELAGMFWKSARRTLLSGDNMELYGATLLLAPVIGLHGTNLGPQNEVLYVRLDRGRIFLARANTTHMRSVGKESAASELLKLQIEWAEALHSYETNGYAIKKGHKDGLTELLNLYKVRNLAESPAEKIALSDLIGDKFEELGYPLPADPQQPLQWDGGAS